MNINILFITLSNNKMERTISPSMSMYVLRLITKRSVLTVRVMSGNVVMSPCLLKKAEERQAGCLQSHAPEESENPRSKSFSCCSQKQSLP